MNPSNIGFLKKLKHYFNCLPFDINGKTVCVCLSGGADSVSLLLGMLDIAEEFSFNVCACHFNHLIRGEASDRDEEFCKRLCHDLSVKLFCGCDDVPAFARTYKMSIEEAARECRYSFFQRILEKNDIDYCATAHNMNDDAETLIFNLLRGSSTDGSASISPYNGNILRPMLKISRNEVEEFLKLESQEFVTDATNFSNEYTRNFIRNVIFPKFCEINPSFVNAFSKYIDSSRIDRDYFESVIAEKLECDLRKEHKAIRFRTYVKKCKDAFGITLNRNMIEQIDAAVFLNSRSVINVNSHIDAVIEKGNVSFLNSCSQSDKRYEPKALIKGDNLLFDGKVSISIGKFEDLKKINNLSTQTKISSANIVGDLYVRNRRVGDRIKIHGINKSVKKLLIDNKVPKEYRNIIPIICDSEGILYIPFVGINDRVFTVEDEGAIFINTVFHTIDQERWVKAYEK